MILYLLCTMINIEIVDSDFNSLYQSVNVTEEGALRGA